MINTKSNNGMKNGMMEESQYSMFRNIYRNVIKREGNNKEPKIFQDSSSYTQRKKAIALGKTIPDKSFFSYDKNTTHQAVRRMRSSGSVVPAKVRL
jgi:hypothetical protein